MTERWVENVDGKWTLDASHTHAGTDCFNPACPVNVELRGGNVNDVTQGGVPADLDARIEQLHTIRSPLERDLFIVEFLFPGLIAERKALRERELFLYEHARGLSAERDELREEVERLRAIAFVAPRDVATTKAAWDEAEDEVASLRAQLAEQQAENKQMQLGIDAERESWNHLHRKTQAENAKLIAWQKAAAEERIALRGALSLARSIILSGEKMSVRAEKEILAALDP